MIRRLLIALLLRLTRQPSGFPPFSFHDNKGRAYYSWPSVADLPEQRFHEIQAILTEVDMCRPRKATEELVSAIEGKAHVAMRAKKVEEITRPLASIVALSKELLLRNQVLPMDSFYALAAACCVREDEDPRAFDKAIHQQKCNEFAEAGRAGRPFFVSPILIGSVGALTCTESGLKELHLASIREEARRKAILKAIE